MRYTGSDYKRARRLQFTILGNGLDKKREYGPGQHGKDRKKKASEYGRQLIEKQKCAQYYGINERQFRRLFLIARADKETVTGLAFFRILESRLDNLVYRMGFARTRRAARQLVNHGHITVNGKKVDIPSYICAINDVIAVKESSRGLKVIKESLESCTAKFGTVEVDPTKLEGKYTRFVERNEVPQDIDENQIIEWYNRQL